MSYAERHVVSVTTAADGSATAYSPIVNGRLAAIHYIKTDFANGSTMTVSSEATGQILWTQTGVNATASVAPRQPTHSSAGAAALYAAAGAAVNDHFVLANDRLKIVIASGGNSKTGAYHLVIE